MGDADKFYIGFRDFVDKEKLKDYDNEYYSEKRHSYKSMIPFINKYIDIDSLQNKVTDIGHINLITYFLQDYCLRNSKVLKKWNVVKGMSTTIDRNFLFKSSSFSSAIYKPIK